MYWPVSTAVVVQWLRDDTRYCGYQYCSNRSGAIVSIKCLPIQRLLLTEAVDATWLSLNSVKSLVSYFFLQKGGVKPAMSREQFNNRRTPPQPPGNKTESAERIQRNYWILKSDSMRDIGCSYLA